jgi:hypothetical protein
MYYSILSNFYHSILGYTTGLFYHGVQIPRYPIYRGICTTW